MAIGYGVCANLYPPPPGVEEKRENFSLRKLIKPGDREREKYLLLFLKFPIQEEIFTSFQPHQAETKREKTFL
jgi:hypothetical protein